MGKVWERPGRGHGSELSFFWFFPWFFCSLAKNLENTKKKVQTHGQGLGYPHTNQKNKKQETKKTKSQKKQKYQDCTPQGEGVRCRVLGLVFLFFCFFCFFFFCFFGFLVCVWIAITDVPSRDCQALSVVALEARSIHYSTAMFAMT